MARHRKERRKVMKAMIMSPEKLKRALAIKDLTDPQNGVHAINLLVERIRNRLSQKEGWPSPDLRRSASPISSVANDFDRLYFPPDSPARSPVYTRYIDKTRILRTHTTAIIPDILVEISQKGLVDYVVLCPGICYRRDVTDKKHTGGTTPNGHLENQERRAETSTPCSY